MECDVVAPDVHHTHIDEYHAASVICEAPAIAGTHIGFELACVLIEAEHVGIVGSDVVGITLVVHDVALMIAHIALLVQYITCDGVEGRIIPQDVFGGYDVVLIRSCLHGHLTIFGTYGLFEVVGQVDVDALVVDDGLFGHHFLIHGVPYRHAHEGCHGTFLIEHFGHLRVAVVETGREIPVLVAKGSDIDQQVEVVVLDFFLQLHS